MTHRLPPLQSVEAFLAAARSLNFHAAAEHIAISSSAFSRRIQQLESAVGVRLFERSQSGVRLTQQGELYLAEIEPAIGAIRRATGALRKATDRAALRVATSHSFAANWLASRLAHAGTFAGVQIELVLARDTQLLRTGRVDVAIWGGMDDHAPSEELFAAEAVAVAGSNLRGESIVLGDVAEMSTQRLLSVQSPASVWERWLTGAGFRDRTPRCLHFDTLQHVYDAADNGLGIGLAIPLVFEPHQRTQRLRACMPVRIPLATGYRLYFADPSVARHQPVVRFREWLRAEVARSLQLFDLWWDGQLARLRHPLPEGHSSATRR